MAATPENPIIFYDIYSRDGSWSPSTYKTRLTLNYKRLPYRVEYVSLADIETKLKELGVPPSSSNPYFKYTLPMIADPSNDSKAPPTYVVDSFGIAIYLDEKYPAPNYPTVIPPGTRALQKIACDQVLNAGRVLAPLMVPHMATRANFLDERGQEYFNRTRSAMFGKELSTLFDSADEYWGPAQAQWGALGKSLDSNGDDGPFVMGNQISFADFAIGGLLHYAQKTEGGNMTNWKKVATWQDGRWAAFWEEIVKLETDSSEVVV